MTPLWNLGSIAEERSILATSLPSDCREANCVSVGDAQSKPRVLFLVDQLTELGGGERTVLTLSDELRRRGYDPKIITFRNQPDPEAMSSARNVRILAMGSCLSLAGMRTAVELARIIRAERIQIVHTFFETSDIFGAVVARLAGVRVVLSSRRDMGILRSSRHRLAYRLLSRAYTKVLAVSDSVREWHLKADHLDPTKIVTLRNGLDIDRFSPSVQSTRVRRSFNLSEERILVTTVANVNVWKGLDTFVETAALVCKDYSNVEFCVAGEFTDKELADRLQQRAVVLGIRDRFHLLGRVADVHALLRSSDIFCLLSQSEGFPNVVLEAMAVGLPVIATAVGGTPEAVGHSGNGLLVDVNDPSAVASHISTLIANPKQARQIGESAREHVQANFSLEGMIEKYIGLYASLLAHGSEKGTL